MSMTAITGDLFFKKKSNVWIEETWFRFYYTTTVSILVLFASLVCFKDYFGDAIKCTQLQEDDNNEPVIPQKVLENYCFIATTYTVPSPSRNAERIRPSLAGLVGGYRTIKDESEMKFHAYYQWVPFFLFFQAISFYVPHRIWKSYERSKLRSLLQNLNVMEMAMDKPEERPDQLKSLAKYIVNSVGLNNGYITCYIICEFLNVVVCVGNLLMTEHFLNYQFSTYGFEVLSMLDNDPEERMDPMTRVFPKVTKCLFHKFGPSGSIERFDALCVLSRNILSEKIFAFTWFWFLILAALSTCFIIYRMITLISLRVRISALSIPPQVKDSQVVAVLKRVGVSQWMLLKLIRNNVDEITFQKLLVRIYDDIDE